MDQLFLTVVVTYPYQFIVMRIVFSTIRYPSQIFHSTYLSVYHLFLASYHLISCVIYCMMINEHWIYTLNCIIDPDANYFHETNSINDLQYYSIAEFGEFYTNHSSDLMTVSFNIRSFNANFDKFRLIFNSNNWSDIIILCETWFDPQNCVDIPNYNSYHTVRLSGRGAGVCIYKWLY